MGWARSTWRAIPSWDARSPSRSCRRPSHRIPIGPPGSHAKRNCSQHSTIPTLPPSTGLRRPRHDGTSARALILELVDGETLAERIARGSLPLGEALGVASQIAAALDAAHRKGIVHRDLKPANIKVTTEGVVKVLDFGLAKAFDSRSKLSDSPTITTLGTQVGVVMGTAGYMSPEQARGQPVDARTDIWAFGCVLYEMLTGRRTFDGQTMSDTIARILEREPDWAALPRTTPPRVRDLLKRCLTKDPVRAAGRFSHRCVRCSIRHARRALGRPGFARWQPLARPASPVAWRSPAYGGFAPTD